MASIQIEAVSGDALRADAGLRAEMHALAAPSYQDPTAILHREWDECTLAYLGWDCERRLVCFYLTAWHSLRVQDSALPAVHLGLSATRQDTKNLGYVGHLYARCLRDVVAWEAAHGLKRILWSTTASPTVFLAVTRFLSDAEPRPDGSFSAWGGRIAGALRERLGAATAPDGEHPFVVKGIAHGTRYSVQEQDRIRRVAGKKRFSLFEDLAVDETRNDRLIFIARSPDDFPLSR